MRTRRARVLLGSLVMVVASSGCTVLGPYPNHGFFGCFLQVGPGDAPNVPQQGTVVPIVGELLWEICYQAD